ncbi:UbiA prenyltransferase family-domain-containing protein [Cladochytrium replicatum]|nr:UbiA prenyltransferase family-domain-containing protein [Cladochytrium replicatum]
MSQLLSKTRLVNRAVCQVGMHHFISVRQLHGCRIVSRIHSPLSAALQQSNRALSGRRIPYDPLVGNTGHGFRKISTETRKAAAPASQTHIKLDSVPPDPSTILDSEEFAKLKWKRALPFTPAVYKELSKARLSAFVILTAMAGYAMAPGAANLVALFWTTAGTGLCVMSANAINQWIEHPYDAQMARTRNRPMVRHALSPLHAFVAGTSAGVIGTGILAAFVNPITAALGFSNIILYTMVYTPLKRTSISNTWAGAVVGAIPPMMGWAACTGALDPGAWVLAAFLYAWQFPHFNALSWNLRADYSKAGYRMASVVDPALNARVSLRYSLAMYGLAYAAPYLGMTSWWFALDFSILNTALTWYAYKFWRSSNDQSARQLFFVTLLQLPIGLALLMIHKFGVVDSKEDEEDGSVENSEQLQPERAQRSEY